MLLLIRITVSFNPNSFARITCVCIYLSLQFFAAPSEPNSFLILVLLLYVVFFSSVKRPQISISVGQGKRDISTLVVSGFFKMHVSTCVWSEIF